MVLYEMSGDQSDVVSNAGHYITGWKTVLLPLLL